MTIGRTSVCITFQGGTDALWFDVPFEVLDKSDVRVTAFNFSGDIVDFLPETDYRVETLQPAGERKTHRLNQRMQTAIGLVKPLPVGWRLLVRRRMDITQENSLLNFHPNTVENSLDKLTMICQETAHDVDLAGRRIERLEKDGREEIPHLKASIGELRGETAGIRSDFASMRIDVEKRFGELEEHIGGVVAHIDGKMPTAPESGAWLGQGDRWVWPAYPPDNNEEDEAMHMPMYYSRSNPWSCSETALIAPTGLYADVEGQLLKHVASDGERIDLAVAANWDNPQWVSSKKRAGLDFYIYAWKQPNIARPLFIVSNNGTVPEGAGFTAGNTRKLGGFHCLCADVGTIAGHPLSGMTAGQILPASVWDLRHRPVAEPVGMAYSEGIDAWVQIYVAGIDGYSRFGVPYAKKENLSDIEGCPAGSWLWFNNTLGKMNMRLPLLSEYLVIARGSALDAISSEDYNPNAGGHTSKSGRRMISNIGLEDVCGYIPQLCGDVCTPYNVPGLDASSGHVIFDGYGRANGLLRIYNFGGHFSLDGHGTLSINSSPLTYMHVGAWDLAGRGCCPSLRFE